MSNCSVASTQTQQHGSVYIVQKAEPPSSISLFARGMGTIHNLDSAGWEFIPDDRPFHVLEKAGTDTYLPWRRIEHLNNEVEYNAIYSESHIGWLRLKFRVSDTMQGKSMQLCLEGLKKYDYIMPFYSAVEVYRDGILLRSIGRIDEKGMSVGSEFFLQHVFCFLRFPNDSDEHVIALRISTSGLYKAYASAPWIAGGNASRRSGLTVSLMTEEATDKILNRRSFDQWNYIVALTVSLVLCVLHVLLFLLNRKDKRLLYTIVFTLVTAFLSLTVATNYSAFSPSIYEYFFVFIGGNSIMYGILWAVILLMPFRIVTKEKIPWWILVYVAVLLYTQVAYTFVDPASYHFFVIRSISGYVVLGVALITLRYFLVLFKGRREEVLVVGIGVFIVVSALMVEQWYIKHGLIFTMAIRIYIRLAIYFSLPVSMAVQLAYHTAHLNNKLAQFNHELEETIGHSTKDLQIANEEISRQVEVLSEQAREIELSNSQLEEQKMWLENTLHQLRTAQVQLVQSEKMSSLGILTAGIAHEINNPVNYVSASVRALRRDMQEASALIEQYKELVEQVRTLSNDVTLQEKFQRIDQYYQERDIDFTINEINTLIKNIENGTSRITEIVQGLRTFARLDNSDWKQADLIEGLEATLVILHSKLKHTITVVRIFDEIPHVECLPGEINQVFMNILSNAIQAIEESGTITIAVKHSIDKVHIEISDTGIGMTEEVRQHIFEPFFTTKDIGSGTGLGLSIVIGIILKHNGFIEVESKVGVGTTFYITLPIKQIV